MLTQIFTPQTAQTILDIAGTVETDTEHLLHIIQTFQAGKYQGTKVEGKVKGLLDLYETFNIVKKQRKVVDDPSVIAKELMKWSWEAKEHFLVVCLDVKHNIKSVVEISKGTSTECLVSTKEVFNTVITHNADRIIIAHNHPSGSLEPSPEDIQLTRQLLKAAEILSIPVLDHIIVGWGDYVSLNETTTLWEEKL